MFDYKVTKASTDRINVSQHKLVALRRQMYSYLLVLKEKKNGKKTKHIFYSNVMALVKLCNTVNRIGVSLFHTQTVCESNQPA